jgi:DNA-binding response OmpR family regulator
MPKPTKAVVLVADDEPSTRALVAGHLRSKGYKVIEAGDGDEAWELAHEHLPHAVVLDVMMPGMSGWEVCRKIREAVSLAHTGVVMLTGIGENLNELTSPLYGADAYVDKPFEFGDLDQKLAETLARRTGGAVGRPDGADQQPPPSTNGKPRGQTAKPAPRAKKAAAKAKPKASAKPTPKAKAKAKTKAKPAPRPAAKKAKAKKAKAKTKTKAAPRAKPKTKSKPAARAKAKAKPKKAAKKRHA